MLAVTLGQKLRDAREASGITLDEAARATKIRAIRLAEIEHDVYANCPSITYARGFALIYGEFVGVDVTPHLAEFDASGSAGLDDYQYLSHKPVVDVPNERKRALGRDRVSPAGRRLASLVTAAIVFFLLGFSYVVYVNFQRLGDLDRLHAKQNGLTPAEGEEAPKTAFSIMPSGPPAENAPSLSEVLVPAAVPTPAAAATPRMFPRRGPQGLHNSVIHAPPQPRPDLFE